MSRILNLAHDHVRACRVLAYDYLLRKHNFNLHVVDEYPKIVLNYIICNKPTVKFTWYDLHFMRRDYGWLRCLYGKICQLFLDFVSLIIIKNYLERVSWLSR